MNRILKQSGFHHMGLLERLYRRLYRDPNERDPDEIDMISVTEEGVMVIDTYFDRERIQQLVAAAGNPGIRRERPMTNADGSMEIRIPELGVATMTRGGTVEVGGVEIQRRSWLYKEIARLFLAES